MVSHREGPPSSKPPYSTCIFCEKNDSKASKEDLLPKWIARLFPGDGKTRFKASSGRLGNPSWPERQFEKVGGFGWEASGPCQRCNRGWMSNLETRARLILIRLMSGESCTVHPEQLLIIAQWAVKTALIYDGALQDAAQAWKDITGNLSPSGPGAARRRSHGKIVLRVA
jgi:hypothetical protein